ncbi:MAG: DUF3108 domain-containing protein [Sulfurimonas sp.]
MKKTFLMVSLWLLIAVSSEAEVLDVKYKVTFGLFGELGYSQAHLETEGDRYTITIEARATGLARILSRDRKEKHISRGFISHGRYYASRYTVETSYGNKRTYKRYQIDHQSKKVIKTKEKYKEEKLISRERQTLRFYSSDDPLTLYFNLPGLIHEGTAPGRYKFKAIGTENQEGTVELILPEKKKLPEYQKVLGSGDYLYLTAIIDQNIFLSDKGELMIAVGKEGIAQKAVLKDLIMFGDLTAERVQ